MGRRNRHFNPAHVAAVEGNLCLDARSITGVSSGAGLQTWASRSGGVGTFTQATAGNRPVYSARSVGGQPGVEFAAPNNHWMSSNPVIGPSDTGWRLFICGDQSADGATTTAYAQSADTAFLGSWNTNYWCMRVNDRVLGFNAGNGTTPQPTPQSNLWEGSRPSSTVLEARTRTNGSVVSDTAVSDFATAGRNASSPNSYSSPTLLALCVASSGLNDSTANRILTHYALSFKLTA